MNVSYDKEVSPELVPHQLMWMNVVALAAHDATSLPNLRERRSIITFQAVQADAREWLFGEEHAEGRERAERCSGICMAEVIDEVKVLIQKGLTDPRWKPPIRRRRNRA